MHNIIPEPPPVLLDGAMGTQLGARGFELRAPLFSARALFEAPELVEAIHLDYLLAGAQILTTNSFGLHVGTLAGAGWAERQFDLVARSVEILDHVRAKARALDPSLARFRIAGSIPPRPKSGESGELSGSGESDELGRASYAGLAAALLDAGADLILLETFTDTTELGLALAALRGCEAPVWASVAAGAPVPGSNRPDGRRLVGGEAISSLIEMLDFEAPPEARRDLRRPDALLLNCTQIDAVPPALDALLAAPAAVPLGLMPHLGKRRSDGVWIERIVQPEVFAEQIHAWMQSRPRFGLAGACCGSAPDDIAALRRRLQPDEDTRERAFIRLADLIP